MIANLKGLRGSELLRGPIDNRTDGKSETTIPRISKVILGAFDRG